MGAQKALRNLLALVLSLGSVPLESAGVVLRVCLVGVKTGRMENMEWKIW